MRKSKNYLYIFLICFVSIFSSEIIFKYLTNLSISKQDLLYLFLAATILSSLLSLFSLFLSKNKKIVFLFSFLFLFNIYMIFEIGFLNFLGVFASINAKSQLGAVRDYVIDFLKSFRLNYFLIALPLILLFVAFLTVRKRNAKYNNIFKKSYVLKIKLLWALSFLTVFFFSTATYFNLLNNHSDNKELFTTAKNPNKSIKKFGVLAYGVSDVLAYFNKENDFLNNIEIVKEEKAQNLNRTVDDSLWTEVAEGEKNQTYNVIHEYLLNRKITDKNDYTGIFKGKSLIIIMMESINDVILNEKYFPNFSKLMDSGIYFENNYSPRNTCPTGNNEFSGNTSLYTIYNSCTANVYKNNTYPYSLYNLFKNEGYYSIGMHNYTEAYYARRTTHLNMGADKYYDVLDLNIKFSSLYHEWSSDEDFFESATEIIEKSYLDKPFMLWLTTVSAHQPYNHPSIEGDLYLDFFKGEDYPLYYKRYLSKVKVTDEAIGILVKRLKDLSIYEDTVFLLYGDHYAYSIRDEVHERYLNRSFDDYENDLVPLLISNAKLKKEVSKTYSTYMDIAPTIANLFDLDFDPRLYFGEDLFSKERNNYAVFTDGSWKCDNIFYNAYKNKVEYYSDILYNLPDVEKTTEKIKNDIKISNLIIKYNYFEYLNKELNKLKEKERE